MNKMTYKIVYSPANDDGLNTLDRGIKFLCSDNKLHVRLRDYDREEVIHGFIDKLTYLVTYLFQRNVNADELTDNIIEKFVNSDTDINVLNTWLQTHHMVSGLKYKGLKIFKNYRKIQKSKNTPSGSFIQGTCPLKNGVTYGGLEFFLDSLHGISLEKLLLNDAIDIVISRDITKNNYQKFVNKSKKVKKEKLEYIPLF